MRNIGRIGLVLGMCLGVLWAPNLAFAGTCPPSMPGCVSVVSMPVPSGIRPPDEIFTNVGDTVTFVGSLIDRPQGLILGANEALSFHPTFTHLLITTNYAPGIEITPHLGTLGGTYANTWTTTMTSNGIELDWRPGAPKLGQPLVIVGGPTQYVALELQVDVAGSNATDFRAFDAATFKVQATPEPGLITLGSGLLVAGGLLMRRARSRNRNRSLPS